MKHNLFSRFISVLLAVVMLAGLMSMPSLADTVDTVPETEATGFPEAQTAGDEAQTAGDEAQTAGDETQTAGDEAQTAGDETQTAGDEAQTAGDEMQTAGDDVDNAAAGDSANPEQSSDNTAEETEDQKESGEPVTGEEEGTSGSAGNEETTSTEDGDGEDIISDKSEEGALSDKETDSALEDETTVSSDEIPSNDATSSEEDEDSAASRLTAGTYSVQDDRAALQARANIPTITSVQPEGVKVNLFDYDTGYAVDAGGNGNNYTWFWPRNQSNYIYQSVSPSLDTPDQLQFSNGDDGQSWKTYEPGRWPWDPPQEETHENLRNDFNKWTKQSGKVYQGIVEPNLEDGYPVITDTDSSLAGLFSTDGQIDNITPYEDVQDLFLNDGNGYYSYNSDENFAELKKNDDGTYKFVLYEGTNSNKFGSAEAPKFLPFNTLTTDGYSDNYVIDGTPDYHFGMTIDFGFIQPASGQVKGEDMEFAFTGDDDVWLFIDDMLVLDMGGIHNKATGTVNFATGDIRITHSPNKDSVAADPIETTLYECYETALQDQGLDESEVQAKLNDIFEEYADGKYRFKDYSSHTFKYFYLERGAGGSNCQIKFNIPSIPTNDLAVSKQITNLGSNNTVTTDTPFTFELQKNGVAEANASYKVYSLDAYTQDPSNPGTPIAATQTVASGQFELKADQVAVFEDIVQVNDPGTYTVKEVMQDSYKNEISSVYVNGAESESHQATLTSAVRYASFNNWIRDNSQYSLSLTKQWKDKLGNTVPDGEIPFSKVEVDVVQYYKTGTDSDSTQSEERVLNSATLTLTKENSWTGSYSEQVFNYTAFRATEERVYVSGEDGSPVLVVTYTYNNGAWTETWAQGMQDLYPEWTIGEFAFDRQYTSEGTNFKVIPENRDSEITIPASNCLIVANGNDAVIWMPYLDELSTSARTALKKAIAESSFEKAWGKNTTYYFIDEPLPTNLSQGAKAITEKTYSNDGQSVTVKFDTESSWNKVAYGEVKIQGDITTCSLSNTLDKAQAKISIPVQKVWADDNVGDVQTIEVSLMNGETTVKTITLSADNQWKGSFDDLEKYDEQGNLIDYFTYSVTDTVQGYVSSSSYANDVFTITNTPSDGYLTIHKVLEKDGEPFDGLEENGKNVFTFRIKATSGENDGKVWYAFVDGNGYATLTGGKSEEAQMKFAAGDYEITELSNINYTCSGAMAVVDGKQNTSDNGTITVKVGGNAVTAVTYTNTVQNKGLTDGSGVINKFSEDNEKKISFQAFWIAGDDKEVKNEAN